MSTKCENPEPHPAHEWEVDGLKYMCLELTTCQPRPELLAGLDLPLAEFDPYTPPAGPRTFNLVRYDDVSDVSGTGIVAQGCQFRDGHIALRWCVPTLPSTWNLFDSLEDLLLLNGHKGRTVVKWTDGRD